jgi:transcription initiation factor TFIIB
LLGLNVGDKKMVTDQNTGELFCGKCGFVVTDKIADTGAEWRSFTNDESSRARTGAGTSLTMHDMGLSTVIGTANKDATGHKHILQQTETSDKHLMKWVN